MLFCFQPLFAQTASPQGDVAKANPKLYVDVRSSGVSLGKATLNVDPLFHRGALYTGSYQLGVVPYIFLSEKGKLELDAPEDTMKKILGGVAVTFTGKASNDKQGKPKVITGKLTPADGSHGSVTFSVQTDNGPMVFNTSYHLGE